MHSDEFIPTALVIQSARRTTRRIKQIIDELESVRREVSRSMEELRWLRYLDFDPQATEFVQNLDPRVPLSELNPDHKTIESH